MSKPACLKPKSRPPQPENSPTTEGFDFFFGILEGLSHNLKLMT